MFNILLFGPPGVGKGTQSNLIKEQYDLEHLSTGDMLRAARKSETELGNLVAAIMDAGTLVSDEIVNELVQERVTTGIDKQGFIFDGYPRTVAQARYLDDILDKAGSPIAAVVFLESPEEELIERLLKRAQDQGRADDTKEVIEARIVNYNAQTLPVAKYYQSQGKLQMINGVGSIEEVATRIRTVLEKVRTAKV